MKATSTDVTREAIRGALLQVVARNNGVLNPRQVLEVARDPTHILHGHFEWDDTIAGDHYRLAQVSALIRHVRLTVVRQDDASREITISTTRGFQSRPSLRKAAGGYEPIGDILSDTAKRAELLAHVLRELLAYRKRYSELSELQAIWLMVDEVASDLETSSPPPPTGGDSPHGAASEA
jgi:hypothetical protein